MVSQIAQTKLVIQAVSRGFKDVEKQLADTNKRLDETEKKGKASSKGVGALGSAFGGLGSALATLGLGLTLKQMGQFLVESTKLAARVETLGVVTQVLGRNAGYAGTEIVALERAIQAKGITTQSSRKALALMMQAELDLADATDLARLSQDAAVIAGINSSEAFTRLIHVVTSGNVIMARRMGLQVNFNQGYQELAERLGVTAEELTASQKAQERLNIVMEEGVQIAGAYEGAMDSVGKQLESTARYVEEFKVAFGESTVGIAGTLNLMYQGTLGGLTAVMKARTLLDDAEKKGLITSNEATTRFRNMLLGLEDGVDVYTELLAILDEYELWHEQATEDDRTWTGILESLSLAGETRIAVIKAMMAATGEAEESTKSFLDEVDRKIASPIKSFIDDLEWFLLTGGKPEEAFKTLQAAAEKAAKAGDKEGLGEIKTQATDLDMALIDVQGKMENLYPSAIAAKIRDELGVPFQEALAFVAGTDGLEAALARLTEEQWQIDFYYNIIGDKFTGVTLGSGYGEGNKPTPKARGGQLGSGVSLVGEEGYELIIDGMVIPHEQSKKMMRMGLIPGRKLYTGSSDYQSERGWESTPLPGKGGVYADTTYQGKGTVRYPGASRPGASSSEIKDMAETVETAMVASSVQAESSTERLASTLTREVSRGQKETADLLRQNNILLARLATAEDIIAGTSSAVGELL